MSSVGEDGAWDWKVSVVCERNEPSILTDFGRRRAGSALDGPDGWMDRIVKPI